MLIFVLQRLVQTVVFAFLIAVLVFSMIHLVPGDPALVILGDQGASPERVAALRERLGLDRSLPVQFISWLGSVARGDLGTSLISSRPVSVDIGLRFPRTLELIASSIVFSLVVGLPLGILAAIHVNRPIDILLSAMATLGLAVPVFVTGTLMVLLFSLQLDWFPASGFRSFYEDASGHLSRLVLPAVSLSTVTIAIIVRMARSSMLEVLSLDFMRTARAKGIHGSTLLVRHGLRNAIIPVIAVVGVQISSLVGGTVLIEFIFNWPGLSSMLITGIAQRDYPIVQGVVLVISIFVLLTNMLVDLSYGMVDPRIRNG